MGCTGVNAKSQRVKDQEGIPPHQYQVASFGRQERQEEEGTDINAVNGKGPGWGQQGKGKSKGKGKGKDQRGGNSKMVREARPIKRRT